MEIDVSQVELRIASVARGMSVVVTVDVIEMQAMRLLMVACRPVDVRDAGHGAEAET